MKTKLSKRTLALLVAAGLLLSVGTVTGTRALPNIVSEHYRAHFYLNHLQVHLWENGKDVCGEKNTLDGSNKITGALATDLNYKDDSNLGSVEPGKVYKEEIYAQNGKDISQFVRITVRKYWVETDGKGNVLTTKDAAGNTVPEKTTKLSPKQIHLMYGGEDGYNSGSWFENPKERTTESSTYYYKDLLEGDEFTDLLFDQIKIDKSVAAEKKEEPPEEQPDGRKIYTYTYKYDGCAFYIEADVQAIQAHNVQDAIRSQWSQDIAATYTENEDGSESGSLSLK